MKVTLKIQTSDEEGNLFDSPAQVSADGARSVPFDAKNAHPLLLLPGPHTLTASEGKLFARRDFDVSPGKPLTIKLVLK